jgi:hypothetical protein
MEPLRSSRVGKVVSVTGLVFLILALSCLTGVELAERHVTKGASPLVSPAIRSVYGAYLRSKVTGAYWENEMLVQSQYVSKLNIDDRLEFYRAILLNCDLDTSRAFQFAELVGADAHALRKNLEDFRDSNSIAHSEDTAKVIEGWIEELKILEDGKGP